jgi:hypothetical protein
VRCEQHPRPHGICILAPTVSAGRRRAADLLDAAGAGRGPLAGLDGSGRARLLLAGGYSADELAADGRIGPWELRFGLAQGEPRQPRGGEQQRRRRQQGTAADGAPAVAPGAAEGGAGGGGPAGGAEGAPRGGGGSGVVVGDAALHYLRAGCAGLMSMRAGREIPDLLIGTTRVRRRRGCRALRGAHRDCLAARRALDAAGAAATPRPRGLASPAQDKPPGGEAAPQDPGPAPLPASPSRGRARAGLLSPRSSSFAQRGGARPAASPWA